jgi:hypothetical protein
VPVLLDRECLVSHTPLLPLCGAGRCLPPRRARRDLRRL